MDILPDVLLNPGLGKYSVDLLFVYKVALLRKLFLLLSFLRINERINSRFYLF